MYPDAWDERDMREEGGRCEFGWFCWPLAVAAGRAGRSERREGERDASCRADFELLVLFETEKNPEEDALV